MESFSRGGGTFVENVHADSNGAHGMQINFGNLSGNTATGNYFAGFVVGYGCVVSGNTARSNGNYGIFVACPCSVVGNAALDNGVGNLFTSGGCALANNAAP
jgi:parallel beta-helix repeat protein